MIKLRKHKQKYNFKNETGIATQSAASNYNA